MKMSMIATQFQKTNVTIPVDVIKQLDSILSKRQRSKFIVEAIEEKMKFQKRSLAYEKMLKFRKKNAHFTEEEILEDLRNDRQSH